MPVLVQSSGLLVTAADVQQWLPGTDTARARSIAEMVSATVRGYVGQSILLDSYTEVVRVAADLVFRPHDDDELSGPVGVVRLRQRPVVQVQQVVADGDVLTASEWMWDETRGEVLLEDHTFYAAQVTYLAGYFSTPDDVRAVALSLATDMVRNPTGVQSERLGDYSVTYGAGGGLNDYHRAVLDRYRPRVSTVRPA